MKIGALVPVRLSSQRMPGKALMPIMGRPAILHLLDRLFASRYLRPRDVILCTTNDKSDDPLTSVAESVGARVFQGSNGGIETINDVVAAASKNPRLTLDYPEDLAFFEALFMELYKESAVFGIDQIVSLLRRRPDLLGINSMVNEEYWKRTHQLAQLEYRMDGKVLKVGDLKVGDQ